MSTNHPGHQTLEDVNLLSISAQTSRLIRIRTTTVTKTTTYERTSSIINSNIPNMPLTQTSGENTVLPC